MRAPYYRDSYHVDRPYIGINATCSPSRACPSSAEDECMLGAMSAAILSAL
jgi:hypothetical protein